MRRILWNKIKEWWWVRYIQNGYVRCRNWFVAVWKSCERDKCKNQAYKLTFNQQLRLAGFAITTMVGIIFNYILSVNVKDTHDVFPLSIMVTILMIEVGLIFLNFQVTPEDSRIYYYDDIWQKNIFVYFRQDEEHCVGGDAYVMSDCNELYLVPYERIEKQKLFSISKWKSNRVNIDNNKIRLQHGQNEFMMNEVFDKIKKGLQSKTVVPELIEKADIYIKLEESKAYYVLSDGTKGDIDL